MSTQQDIYATGYKNCPPMLNKDNYVPWSSRLLRYAKSKPNGNLIYNSIMNGPYVRRMIPKPGDPDHEVPVAKTFHEQTDDELTKKEVKKIYETAQEIWLRVQQMMKGSDIGIQDKKAKLFNEWERYTSTDGESIESYYHRFSKLMNDFKRNKHFPEKIASNLKFLNNLQLEWRQHAEVNELRAKRIERAHDPLALMANSNNPYNNPVFHQDQPSSITYMQQPQPQPNNNFIPQPSFNTNYMQQPILNPKDIIDPITAINTELVLMAKAFKLNYSTPTNNNQRISSNPRNRQIAQPVQNVGNQVVQNAVQNLAAQAEGNENGNNGNQIRCYNYRGLGHLARNCIVRPRKMDAAFLQTQLLIAQKEEAGIQLQAKEFDFMAAAGYIKEIEEVNANFILMANLQQASTSGTQTNSAPIYDSDGSAENDNNVIFVVSNMEPSGGTVEQHPATAEETRALYNSLYNNLAIEVEKVNTVNRKLKETNDELTTELARYINQEKCFEISQQKYDKLERCYQKSVYQEQCLTKKINALHFSSA
ncbi:hypothetical protein Tco_0005527 [Tanacetum coccineum]